ncbi:MAG: hypothetical protein ACFFB3_18980 [Candidatus Hodarchaeota archaeon]
MDSIDIADETPLFFSGMQIPQDTEEILRFDRCRRRFKKRLEELNDPKKAAAFEPVMRWMHLFVSTLAPELLADESVQEV